MEIIDEKQFNELVKLHKKFILGVVKKYVFTNVELKELNAVGLAGFSDAYRKYDPSSEASLLSYSYNYIKHEVIKYQSVLKYPQFDDKQKEVYRLISKFIDKNYNDYISEIDLEPLSKETGLESKEILNFDKFGRDRIHLNSIVDNNCEKTITYINCTEQKIFKDASYDAEIYYLRKVVNKWLEKLSTSQHTVLTGLFGLNNNDKMSILELSIELNVSTVRIRQIRDQAKYELRKDSEMEQIYNDHFK